MQILRQFGELSPDLIDMQRYAAWKAADIRKALREGRTPTAGPSESAANAEQELLDELGLPSVPGMLCSSTVCTALCCTALHTTCNGASVLGQQCCTNRGLQHHWHVLWCLKCCQCESPRVHRSHC